MAAKVFIDGAAGTTGLEIRERLAGRSDISLVKLSDTQRKDAKARKEALNESDLVILCLPDDAARESVSLIENNSTRVIDASTAHRTAHGWTYGFPELEKDQREKIANSARVSNPGCWPTGFLALMRPFTRAGIVPKDFPTTVTGVSGYSGGGKSMIEEFEAKDSPRYVETVFRTYALTLSHKHTQEMREHSGLSHAPVFSPNVGRFYRGMILEVPLQLWALPAKPAVFELHRAIAESYRGESLIEVAPFDGTSEAIKAMRVGVSPEPPTITVPQTVDAEALKLTNGMKLYVFGNDKTQQARLIAVFDNLGKGASGAAVQNMNIMLGLPETSGLV